MGVDQCHAMLVMPPSFAGLGYADLENRVPCKPETVLRIASISKPLTMVAIAKLWEEGKLDLDAPVQKYVPEFPEKEYEGTKVSKAISKRWGGLIGFLGCDVTVILC